MGKQWCLRFVPIFFILMVVLGSMTIIIDPYFHYHKPLKGIAYVIHNERYQNDGIVKHFDYNALITGTSMAENFKTSEMDMLFGTCSVKVPYSGAAYKEVRDNLERAIAANPNLRVVIWALDYNRFYGDFNATRFDSYPTYLYDYNPFNDVHYFFNKSVLINETFFVIYRTLKGAKKTTFDQYSNWMAKTEWGKMAILKSFKRPERQEKNEFHNFYSENIRNNVLVLVKSHPEIDFYLFWTPYSIVYFDVLSRNGELENVLLWEKEALEILLPYSNVHFFSFFDEFNIITDLNNYKDFTHYHEKINSFILKCMMTERHRLKLDNYESYCRREWDFYTTYEYDSIYK